MIDTVHFTILRPLSSDVRERLGLASDNYSRARGDIGGMYVLSSDCETKVRGSLPNYLRGENLSLFTRGDASRAIEKLADALEIPERDVRASLLRRLDFGVNVVVPDSPSVYLRALRDPGSVTKRNYGYETVTYGKEHQLEFYDKVIQMRRRHSGVWKASLASAYAEKQVLRVEVRLKSSVRRALGRHIRLRDLDNGMFFNKLGSYIMGRVEQVAGKSPVATGIPSDVRRMQRDLQRVGIEAQGGRDVFLARIEEGRRTRQLTPSTAHRMRQAVDRALDAPSQTHWQDKGTELIALTSEAVARYAA